MKSWRVPEVILRVVRLREGLEVMERVAVGEVIRRL